MRLIIDTDAGVDDAEAIMLALAQPGVTVEAITTLTGNIHVGKVVPNVLTITEVMGSSVPVYRGADRSLLGESYVAEEFHGVDGLGDWAERPPITRTAESEFAAVALVRLINAHPGELTLVAIGPHTNIALALMLDPTLPQKVKEFVFMGGAIHAVGNTDSITAEWNIFCDPEAAYLTLKSFPRAVMLSWETTLAHPFAWSKQDALYAIKTLRGRFLKGINAVTDSYLRDKSQHRRLGYLLPDPLAMAIALNPDLIRKSEQHYATVELHGAYTRGQTVIDYPRVKKQPPNVEIVTDVDIDGVYAMFERMLV